MPYQVVVPLVITKKEDGSDLYLYERAVLPDFVSKEEVDRLLKDKFVEKLSTDEIPGDGPPKAAAEKRVAKEKDQPSAESN